MSKKQQTTVEVKPYKKTKDIFQDFKDEFYYEQFKKAEKLKEEFLYQSEILDKSR